MKKQSLILSLILLLACIFVFAGCGSSTSSTETTEPEEAKSDVTRLVSYSDEDVRHALDDMTAEYDKLKTRVDTATADDAESVKTDVDQFKKNVEGFDDELAKAVEDSKLTEDAKKGYDTTIETLKTGADDLDKTLEGKMGS